MRISIPSIPEVASSVSITRTIDEAAHLIASYLSSTKGKSLIMTGAGASVDSGIAPYRGINGHYTIHKTYRPIFYHEFIEDSPRGHLARQRYFSRSYLGFPPVRDAKPNKTHYSIAAIQRLGYTPNLITQNVDGLHHAATPSKSVAADTILELHGTLKNVVCVHSPTSSTQRSKTSPPLDSALYHALSESYLQGPRHVPPNPTNTPTGANYPLGCGFQGSRSVFQDLLTEMNPAWAQLQREMQTSGLSPKTNPDGDVQLGPNVDYSTFHYPNCPNCGGILKPSVIFFGESVPEALKQRSFDLVQDTNFFLLVGTSLATYSAFRLVKHAKEAGKRIVILNQGPTRADSLILNHNNDGENEGMTAEGGKEENTKIELGCSQVLSKVAKLLSNNRELNDPLLNNLLNSGVSIKPNQSKAVVSS